MGWTSCTSRRDLSCNMASCLHNLDSEVSDFDSDSEAEEVQMLDTSGVVVAPRRKPTVRSTIGHCK